MARDPHVHAPRDHVTTEPRRNDAPSPEDDHLRFLARHEHLFAPFGTGSFGAKAEAFARFFGTPRFLLGQTALVALWILANATGIVQFDLYPFILLNLAFSLQDAYAAPLILLAQTRQADRDKAHAESDAEHRETVANDAADRQQDARSEVALLRSLLTENTRLTARIEELTQEIHRRVMTPAGPADARPLPPARSTM